MEKTATGTAANISAHEALTPGTLVWVETIPRKAGAKAGNSAATAAAGSAGDSATQPAYRLARVLESGEHNLQVSFINVDEHGHEKTTGETATVRFDFLFPAHWPYAICQVPLSLVFVADVAQTKPGARSLPDNTQLQHLNDATVLQNLKLRYKQKSIYVSVSLSILSTNVSRRTRDTY